jgi:hypothetical protein
MFLVVVMFKILNQQPSKANVHFFENFVVDQFDGPNNGTAPPHVLSPPSGLHSCTPPKTLPTIGLIVVFNHKTAAT